MRKKKLMSAAALALAGMLAFQSVNWGAFNVLADTGSDASPKEITYYFVDCGDYVVETVNDASMYADDTRDDNDTMGIYQSVTDKAYGVDEVTGKSWGLVADADPNQSAYDGTLGLRLQNAWAFEFNGPSQDWHRNWSNTYSKDDATPSLTWKFELPAGEYTVEACFVNPWDVCSGVKLVGNGTTIGTIDTIVVTNGGAADLATKYGGETISGKVTVGEDGILTLDGTATGACLNCAWIKITGLSPFEQSKVLELSFEDNLTDDTGKHEITSVGTINYSEGVNDSKALKLTGQGYLDMGTDTDLQPEKLTVSFWLKAPTGMAGEHLIVWNKTDGKWFADGWYMGSTDARPIELSLGGSAAENGQPYKAYVTTTRNEFFPAGEWVHVAVTYDSATKTACVYRNGVEQAVVYEFTGEDGLIEGTDSGKWLGCNSPAYGGKSSFEIDEFELYGSVATTEETKELYTKNGGVIVEVPKDDEEDKDDVEYIGNMSAYDLWDVDVTDSYLTNAEDKDIEYLLSLDSDKLLAGFRETAGLDMKGATRYGGWETSLIGSHTMGHYLTAMAQAVASLPDTDSRKAEVEAKLEYIIDELKACQDALGTGFIFGATIKDKNNVELQFDNVEKGLVDINNQAWVPWYTMHKILAGAIDTYKYTGNETALELAKELGDWVYGRTSSWSAGTRNTVLGIEYGGMNDCLYELYAVTGIESYAVAAHAFDEDTLFTNVNKGIANILNGKHANTTIPKFMGALNRYVTTHGKTIGGEVVDASAYLEYAENFFAMVLENHTYITGDNSEWEHFGADNILDAERTNCNCETCNAYNMLKFAKALYMVTGDTKYLDYYETAFYNTILSSQNPETGMTTYFQPMKSGYFKVYGTETTKFWCCTGSGMENFTKLGNAIYYYNDDMIVVSQYLSSVLTDTDKGVTITQTADIPSSDTVKFNVETTKGATNIAFRLPEWLADDAVVKVNGAEVAAKIESGYAIVEDVADGTEITVQLPMEIKAYNLPDGESVYGFKYGPIVLSAKLGTKNMETTLTGVSVTIPAAQIIEEQYISDGSETVSVLSGTVEDFIANINTNLVKTEGKLEWVLENTDANLTFVPHYSQHTERYGIYFNYVSNDGAFNVTKYIRDKAQSRFNMALLDTVQPAYGQYENDELHNMVDNGSTPTVAETTRYANAGGSFTYTMKVAKGEDNCLQVTFDKEDNGKTIKIVVGDEVVYEETLNYTGSEEQYSVRIPVSKEVVADAVYSKTVSDGTYDVVDVTISSADANASARVCNFVYMTKAYSDDTSLDITATISGEALARAAANVTVEKENDEFSIEVDADATSIDLAMELATEYGYVRVNGDVVRVENPYTVDLSNANFVELEVMVYAEDHETTKTYTVNIKKAVDTENRENVDKTLAYFVNCGDYDVKTLSDGDLFGIYNGVTDNAYGIDPITGYKWGVVDTVSNPLKNGTVTNNPAMTDAVFTDNTWTYETDATLDDTSDKTKTNRYTKNQFESGMDRNLKYAFEVPNGKYTVAMYFTDPWNCSKNPIVTAEGVEVVSAGAVNTELTFDVEVRDGELLIDVTSPAATLCLNLSYIKVYVGEELPDSDETDDDNTNDNITDDDTTNDDNTSDDSNSADNNVSDGTNNDSTNSDTTDDKLEENPYTGDAANVFTLVIIALIAGCSVMFVTRKRKITE